MVIHLNARNLIKTWFAHTASNACDVTYLVKWFFRINGAQQYSKIEAGEPEKQIEA
ncbi:hypothetical protein KDH_27060 [Dictyobacter sp. S3.2.2.5]|uniref:Uncharacterized protein n=1 Tax=Dictyobacter halimunensis TaxID=3026934 RepID=A0ABQ6FS58_9CHLR|nr:hypothetical protein KDH_27060 [Dictyobacter sp. S3.2.2.5]